MFHYNGYQYLTDHSFNVLFRGLSLAFPKTNTWKGTYRHSRSHRFSSLAGKRKKEHRFFSVDDEWQLHPKTKQNGMILKKYKQQTTLKITSPMAMGFHILWLLYSHDETKHYFSQWAICCNTKSWQTGFSNIDSF